MAGLEYSLDCGPSRPRNLEDWLGFEKNDLSAARLQTRGLEEIYLRPNAIDGAQWP